MPDLLIPDPMARALVVATVICAVLEPIKRRLDLNTYMPAIVVLACGIVNAALEYAVVESGAKAAPVYATAALAGALVGGFYAAAVRQVKQIQKSPPAILAGLFGGKR